LDALFRKNGGLIERQNHQSLLDANERDLM